MPSEGGEIAFRPSVAGAIFRKCEGRGFSETCRSSRGDIVRLSG